MVMVRSVKPVRRTPCAGGADEVESAMTRHVGRVRGPGGDDIV